MKYLATDLDGTILQKDQTINKEDVEALVKFKEAGNTIIISTGRGLEGIYRAFENYPEIKYDYIVACNGSIVADNNKNIIYNNQIDSDTAIELFEELSKNESVIIHCEDEKSSFLVRPNHNRFDKEIEEYAEKFKSILSIEELLKTKRSYPIISIIAINEDIEIAEEAKNSILKKYGQGLEAYRNQHYVDIAVKNCSKGNGLKKLTETLGVDHNDLYVIGDSYNDLSMFEITENSYTFTYAEDGVKACAKNIVNNEAELINKIL